MSIQQNIKITFLGGVGTVTGSKYLIEISKHKLLIDCGLFQGLKDLRLLNWQHLPFDVTTLDCVLLTHGHLDHVGYLPALVKQGFKGSIYATQPTIEISKLILLDSARIQEEDAHKANLYNYSKHKPAKPLYTVKDAENVFPLFQVKPTNEWTKLFPEVKFKFQYNGHIIGACSIELSVYDKIIVFSGDIGRENDPLMFAPEKPKEADILFLESTYGNRFHTENPEQILANIINANVSKNGTIIIPSFAVERTQLVMYYLWKLKSKKVIPNLPVYIDSPMGTGVTDIFRNNLLWHKLSITDCDKMCSHIKIIKKAEETNQVIKNKVSKIIIAGSGMASGGRVLTYFEHYLNDPNATILLVGYQGEGTRGRALLEGEKEIKMHGKYWPVKAKVALVEGLSAHADQKELVNWLSDLKKQPEKIFITHGDKESSETLKVKINDALGYNSDIPKLNEKYNCMINLKQKTIE